MKVGLVGYSGVGKSTIFQWLTGAIPDPGKIQQGQVAMADVADERLRKIAEVFKPKKLTFAKIEFLDTPGLMADDRADNPRRLAILREANGMVVVLDGFSGAPLAEMLKKFREELLFADLEVLMNRVTKVEHQLRKTKPAKEREIDEYEHALLKRVIAGLEAGTPAKEMGLSDEDEKILRSFQLLTLKSETVLVNRGDSGFNDSLPSDLLELCPTACQAPVKLEMELAALSPEDRELFMSDLGFTTSFREATIRKIFYAMGRIAFFTAGVAECRSWAMTKGEDAVAGASCIHNDLAARFVRARVIGYEQFAQCGYSEKEAKTKGLERLEGKQYIMQDGDVIEIL
jgi:ribosome-binding ATPase